MTESRPPSRWGKVPDQCEPVYRRKPNGRYVAVELFDGFPSDGVWLVTGQKTPDGFLVSVSMQKLGETPPAVGLTRAALEPHRERCYAAIDRLCAETRQRFDQYAADGTLPTAYLPSPASLVDALFAALAVGVAGQTPEEATL